MLNTVAIVTDASQGIGQATAIRLARDFSALALVARKRVNLKQTAEAMKAVGAEALVIATHLPQPAAAQTVVDQTLVAFGRIDGLLNIAGAVPQIDLFEMTDARRSATSNTAGDLSPFKEGGTVSLPAQFGVPAKKPERIQ